MGSSLFAGCNNDDPVTPDAQPEIVFAKESLDVPAEGGPFQIEYTIENPVANATLSAKCNDSWITDIDTKTAGVISFNVTKNETAEKREAIIEVSYADIQPAPSFKVKQTFPNAQPEIVFAKESLDVPAEGGPFQIEYTIENPVANATLSAKCNDSWITDIDTKTAGGHLIQRNQKRNSGKEGSNHRSFVRGYPAGAFFYSKTGGPSGGGIYDNDFGHHHKNIPNYSPSRRPGNVLSVEHHPLPGYRRFQDG